MTPQWGLGQGEPQQMNRREAQTFSPQTVITIAVSMIVSSPPPLSRQVQDTNRNLPPVLLPSDLVLRVCGSDRTLGRGCELRPVTVPNPQHNLGCLMANVSAVDNQLHPFPASLSALLPQRSVIGSVLVQCIQIDFSRLCTPAFSAEYPRRHGQKKVKTSQRVKFQADHVDPFAR